MGKIMAERYVENIGYVDPRFTFDNFVVDPNNESCVLAGRRIVNQPGEVYNPLYVYGGTGLGKSHLVHAIANAFIASDHANIICISSERFVNGVIAAVRNGTTQALLHHYRNADALMMADAQFMAEKAWLQEEFICIFNMLHDRKKQVVFTSGCHPDELKNIDESICSYFRSGLVVEIKAPGFERRLAILTKKAESAGMSLDDNVSHLLASRFTTNIRELEGALTKLGACSALTGETINLNFAKRILREAMGT